MGLDTNLNMNTIDKRRNEMINSAINAMAVTAQIHKKYLSNEGDEPLDEMNDNVEQYCMLDMEYQSNSKALREIEEFYRSGKTTAHIPFETKFQQILKKEGSPKRNAIAQHPIMIHYVRDICDDDDESEKQVANESMGDGDIVASNSFTPPIDPITKTAIRNPVRNKQCGHIYENESIRALILKKNTRCPYIGCPATQHIHITHLVVEEDLKKKIDHYNMQQ